MTDDCAKSLDEALEAEKRGALECERQLKELYSQKTCLDHTKVQQYKKAAYDYAALEGHDEQTLYDMKAVLSESAKYPSKYRTSDTVEFILRDINFGYSEVKTYSGRGRRSKKTQYDLAFDRRKRLFHELVRVPYLLSRLGAGVRLIDGKPLRDAIEKIAYRLAPVTKPHKLTLAVVTQLEKDYRHKRYFCDRVVRRILRGLGYQ